VHAPEGPHQPDDCPSSVAPALDAFVAVVGLMAGTILTVAGAATFRSSNEYDHLVGNLALGAGVSSLAIGGLEAGSTLYGHRTIARCERTATIPTHIPGGFDPVGAPPPGGTTECSFYRECPSGLACREGACVSPASP
jgi:hypothetical protein